MKRFYFLLPLLLPLYVVRFHIGPMPTTLLEVAIGVVTVAWLATRQMDGLRDAWARFKPWRLPAALWIVAGIVATIVSPVHVQALGLYRAYFIEPLIIFFIGLDVVRTQEDRDALWQSFQIATILLAIYAMIQLLIPWIIPHPWNVPPNGPRATSLFPFPNALSLFVTPIAALAAAKVIGALNAIKAHGHKWTKRQMLSSIHPEWMNIITLIAGGIAILCAQSDGGVVALAAAILVTMLIHKHSRRFAIELAIVGLIVIAVIAPLRKHIGDVVLLKDWSGQVRTVIWKESFEMLKDRPIFGAGLSAYPATIAAYHKATWMEIFQYPHNILLNLWSETGLLGIAAFAWIIITWLRRTRSPMWRIGVPVVVALLVHGLVDVPYFKNDLAVAFWFLILLTTMYEHKPHAQ